MKIAIDITPIKGEQRGHKVRGVGFYLKYLKRALLQYHSEHEYVFFGRGEEIDPSVDIIHYPYFEPFFLTLPAKKTRTTIVTVHDLTPIIFPKHFPSGLAGSIRWKIQKFNLQRTQGIITDSYASQRDIIHLTKIKKENIEVAYLAAADEFIKLKTDDIRRKKIIEKYKLPEQFVLYTGDVTWNKNLPRLITAIKDLHLPLVLVGKALQEEDFDRENPWNIDLVEVQKLSESDKRIIKLGFVPTEDLVALYNAATVFVMPSLYEGFGLPVIEAMQSGCPVITTKEGSLPEVAGDAAFYVDAYDAQSIKNGIGEVFHSNKLQQELSEKGLVQAKKFSWKKTADKTIETYERVLKL